MKKNIFVILFLLLVIVLNAQEKSLRAYLSYATFAVPGGNSYVETYLAIEGNSVVFADKEDGTFQASVEISMIFKQEEKVINFAKYELKSPVVYDLNKTIFGIIDQQRFSLTNGEYLLEIEIADLNNPEVPAFKTAETIVLDYNNTDIQISAVQLVEGFEVTQNESILTKNGYDLIPLVYAFYPESVNLLHFYSEIYNTETVFGKDSKYLANYYIESYEGMSKMKDFFSRKRMESKPVNILLNTVDISQLPSGNYHLVVEVRNQKNEVTAVNKVFFQRSNPKVQYNLNDLASVNIGNTFVNKITQIDTLREYLYCIAPIASENERDYAYNLAKTNDLATMQRFFYNFWQKRSFEDPETKWQEYLQEVIKVNAAYKTPVKKGYNTDRGIVYLKYGPPNSIVEVYSEPGAYPYEIWHFYTLGNQRNKRFVFATKDMVTNDFALIHSDAIGELSNYRWQLDIYKRTWDPNNIDQAGPEDAFGNRAFDFYKNPR
jgi:GWxTD domain-containing protein